MPAEYPNGRRPLSIRRISRRIGFRPASFRSPKFYGRFVISGITKDSAGAVLPACDVHLFESAADTELAQTISDGAGAYSFSIGMNSGFFYVVAYKAGSPDVAGTTANTLVAA